MLFLKNFLKAACPHYNPDSLNNWMNVMHNQGVTRNFTGD